MGAVAARLRSELRARWRSWLSLAIVIGLGGGVATAAAAGARRTDSAFARFQQTDPGPDVIISNIPDPSGTSAFFDSATVAKIPGVKIVAETKPLILLVNGQPSLAVAHPASALVRSVPGGALAVIPDAVLGRDYFPYKLLEGRLPNPAKPDEAVVAYVAAQRLHLHVGERVPFTLIPDLAQLYRSLGVTLPKDFLIVGLEVVPVELPSATPTGADFHMTPALNRMLPGPPPPGSLVIALDRGKAGVPAFRAELERVAHGKRVRIIETHDGDAASIRAIHIQAIGLWILAVATSLAIALLFAQLLIRQAFLEAGDNATLQALGMTRMQVWCIAMLRTLLISVMGVVLSLGVALALSPLTPLGLARLAEPHVGFSLDGTALGLGGLGLLVVVAILTAPPCWTAARPHTFSSVPAAAGNQRLRPSKTATAAARLPIATALGARLALDRGRGRTAIPVRTTLATAALSVAAFAMALGIGSSLAYLLATPKLYGLTWDASFQGQASDARRAAPRLLASKEVESFAFGATGVSLDVNGQRVDADIIDPPLKGGGGTALLEGRLPKSGNEIALGTLTLRDLGLHVGDTVQAGVAGTKPIAMHVVGRVVLVPVSSNLSTVVVSGRLRLGDGALLTYEGASRQAPGAVPPAGVFIRFAAGTSRAQATGKVAVILGGDIAPAPFQQPNDVVNFGRVQNLPLVLAAILAIVGLAALTHVIVLAGRSNRRDVAILKANGLTPRQATATALWQGAILTAIALLIGIPTGALAARWIWRALADGLGIVSIPRFPALASLLIVPAAEILTLAIAILPARKAGRLKPALQLRTE